MMRYMFTGILLIAGAGVGSALEKPEERVRALQNRLLAPCCFQQPVSRHESELAVKMRMDIDRMVSEGKSDTDILRTYTERYGERVLVKVTPAPVWAKWVPWGLALLGAACLAWWLPRWVHAA